MTDLGVEMPEAQSVHVKNNFLNWGHMQDPNTFSKGYGQNSDVYAIFP